MHKPRQTSFGVWLFLVLAGLAFAVTMLNSWRKFNLEGPLDQSINVLIRKGSDLDDISRFLQDEIIITDAGLFRLGVRILGNPRRLKAGEYAIPRRASARMIMDILMSGQTVVRRVQAAEGLTSLEIMEILDRSEGLANDEETVPINGALMPDTYHYSYGDSRSSMLARMKIEMDRFLDLSWKDRAPNLPLKDKWEALTLASIVER